MQDRGATFSETPVTAHQNTWRHNADERNLNLHSKICGCHNGSDEDTNKSSQMLHCHNIEEHLKKTFNLFLISNFCRVLNVVRFLPGDSPASEFYVSS